MIKSIIKYITSFFNKEEVKVVEVTVQVEVLSTSALKRLKAQLEPPILSGTCSGEDAAYRLGIQRALSVVEKNFAA